jgi:uncharacterized membrane protein YgcG
MSPTRLPSPRPARSFAAVALVAMLASAMLPALARDAYVMDGAGLFSDATVSELNQQIGDFQQQTGKEVVVDTVASLNGQTVQQAAEDAFARLQVNGVLIFMAKAEKEDLVVPDRASRAFFPPGTTTSIHDAMRGYFRQGDFDGGIRTGVNLVLSQYRSHERSATGGVPGTAPVSQPLPATAVAQTGGSHVSFFWLLIILLAGFLIIRALFRAMAGPRMMPPGAGPTPGPGGPGYGYGPGYGGGYGGGGSFFSGLLGGLGGAWLGNELFGGRGGGTMLGQDPSAAGIAGTGGAIDSSGWQSDAGQADMGNAGGGDWGGGGGFDAGGGGFDMGGGGGGFDAGGGGGDGGGW